MSALYLIAEIHPDPNHLDEAREAFQKLISATKKEKGCLLYDLVENDESGTWLMLEKWESMAAWEAHMETAHVIHHNLVSKDFTVGATKLTFFGPVGEDLQYLPSAKVVS